MKQQISFLFALCGVLLSCSHPSIHGHWKCDRSGIVKEIDPSRNLAQGPITNFYNAIGIDHYEFIFEENGSFDLRSVKTDQSFSSMQGVYEIDQPSKNILLKHPDEDVEKAIIEILDLKANNLKFSMDIEGDGQTFFVLNLIKEN